MKKVRFLMRRVMCHFSPSWTSSSTQQLLNKILIRGRQSSKVESQSGTNLPDSVLVATVLNKTSGALQQHLRFECTYVGYIPTDARSDRRLLLFATHTPYFVTITRTSTNGHWLSRQRQEGQTFKRSRAKLATLKGLWKGRTLF